MFQTMILSIMIDSDNMHHKQSNRDDAVNVISTDLECEGHILIRSTRFGAAIVDDNYKLKTK